MLDCPAAVYNVHRIKNKINKKVFIFLRTLHVTYNLDKIFIYAT